jgi:hypothetical protein
MLQPVCCGLPANKSDRLSSVVGLALAAERRQVIRTAGLKRQEAEPPCRQLALVGGHLLRQRRPALAQFEGLLIAAGEIGFQRQGRHSPRDDLARRQACRRRRYADVCLRLLQRITRRVHVQSLPGGLTAPQRTQHQ